VIGELADEIGHSMERLGNAVSEALFEPVIRLGVTGLARSGKTVFITSLVANLLDRGRMPALRAASTGTIQAAYLHPQPDDTLPRFAYETHLADLTGAQPQWPHSTTGISQLRLSLRVQPSGLLSGLSGPRLVHLDITDYPGEWLLDLALLDKDFATWSTQTLARLRARPIGAPYLAALSAADMQGKFTDPAGQTLAAAFTDYLTAARGAGFADLTPGRFLLPGLMAGSPALTFAPLDPMKAPRGSLYAEFARRYEAYKTHVIKPFFRDHFTKIDRQVVLLDVLGALHHGPAALAELQTTVADILTAFRPGSNSWLAPLLGTKVEKMLFAATKADHLHQAQHSRLAALTAAIVEDAKRRADFKGAQTMALAIAALRSTTEETRTHKGAPLDMVKGLLDTGAPVAAHAGELPEHPAQLLAAAQHAGQSGQIGQGWQSAFELQPFAPAPLTLRTGEGPPHIHLDRAAEFLIGDRL
jgi:predicted YcjX-like family ATPase